MIGCTGFIGNELVPYLLRNGHHLTIVSRSKARTFTKELLSSKDITYLECNPAEDSNWSKGALIARRVVHGYPALIALGSSNTNILRTYT